MGRHSCRPIFGGEIGDLGLALRIGLGVPRRRLHVVVEDPRRMRFMWARKPSSAAAAASLSWPISDSSRTGLWLVASHSSGIQPLKSVPTRSSKATKGCRPVRSEALVFRAPPGRRQNDEWWAWELLAAKNVPWSLATQARNLTILSVVRGCHSSEERRKSHDLGKVGKWLFGSVGKALDEAGTDIWSFRICEPKWAGESVFFRQKIAFFSPV